MNEAAITQYIAETFEDVHIVESEGTSFFFYGPMDNAENKFPFVTLVTNDDHDEFSDLNRPEVFRLNIGVSKEMFRSLFGSSQAHSEANETEAKATDTITYDFTALDQIMPHPIYGKMYWVCMLNPGDRTLSLVEYLLTEAYSRAAQKRDKALPTT